MFNVKNLIIEFMSLTFVKSMMQRNTAGHQTAFGDLNLFKRGFVFVGCGFRIKSWLQMLHTC